MLINPNLRLDSIVGKPFPRLGTATFNRLCKTTASRSSSCAHIRPLSLRTFASASEPAVQVDFKNKGFVRSKVEALRGVLSSASEPRVLTPSLLLLLGTRVLSPDGWAFAALVGLLLVPPFVLLRKVLGLSTWPSLVLSALGLTHAWSHVCSHVLPPEALQTLNVTYLVRLPRVAADWVSKTASLRVFQGMERGVLLPHLFAAICAVAVLAKILKHAGQNFSRHAPEAKASPVPEVKPAVELADGAAPRTAGADEQRAEKLNRDIEHLWRELHYVKSRAEASATALETRDAELTREILRNRKELASGADVAIGNLGLKVAILEKRASALESSLGETCSSLSQLSQSIEVSAEDINSRMSMLEEFKATPKVKRVVLPPSLRYYEAGTDPTRQVSQDTRKHGAEMAAKGAVQPDPKLTDYFEVPVGEVEVAAHEADSPADGDAARPEAEAVIEDEEDFIQGLMEQESLDEDLDADLDENWELIPFATAAEAEEEPVDVAEAAAPVEEEEPVDVAEAAAPVAEAVADAEEFAAQEAGAAGPQEEVPVEDSFSVDISRVDEGSKHDRPASKEPKETGAVAAGASASPNEPVGAGAEVVETAEEMQDRRSKGAW